MDIKLPELGEGIDNVEVTDILVKKGSSVKSDDILMVVTHPRHYEQQA